MTRLGLPVPPGFTITTAACCTRCTPAAACPDGLREQIAARSPRWRSAAGGRSGTPPTRCSCRAQRRRRVDARDDGTILNLGLNDAAAQASRSETGDARFAYDSYRRLLQMFGEVVAGVGRTCSSTRSRGARPSGA